MFYWYFSYSIEVVRDGLYHTDTAVIASPGQFFPMGDVHDYFNEEFGGGAKITVLNSIEIGFEDYKKFADTMDISEV